jgi:C-terminal processing protease CtpA/Prc
LTILPLLRLSGEEEGTKMNKRNLLITGGVAALSLALIALPAPPANSQTPCPDDSAIARLEKKLERLQAKLQGRQDEVAKLAESRARLASSQMVLAQHRQALEQLEAFPQLADADDEMKVLLDDEGSSWLGVELHEVNGDTAKELKLPAERGVVLSSIVPDSPAAKAGLKENDVVTEINGQRVEGAAQFRRMIREIPAARTAQLTVWRDGHAQTVTVALGKAEERRHSFKVLTPRPGAAGEFAFSMPEIPMIPPMEWDGSRFLMGGSPRLGIDAEDLNGQLGTFFGAPDGEGILVREVNPGSAAEKAGVKAGDVITSVNGERVRTVGDLREKLAAKREAKDKNQNQTVKLGVLRNKSDVSVTVELPAPASRTKRLISHRTNI